MSDNKIQPSAITKPIQLLGAWFVGLLTIDGSFLIAATRMGPESGAAIALVVAAIINVPMFLVALFVLQTKFRPELQEDSYYSSYISLKTNQAVSVPRDEQLLSAIQVRIERMESAIQEIGAPPSQGKEPGLLHKLKIGVNKHYIDDKSIVDLLEENDIAYTTFGGNDAPMTRIVAISDHLSKESREAAFALAVKMGFERYDFFDGVLQDITEDVLIGAYGHTGRPIVGAREA